MAGEHDTGRFVHEAHESTTHFDKDGNRADGFTQDCASRLLA